MTNSSPKTRFAQSISKWSIFDFTVLAAVSGGADSVLMLRWLHDTFQSTKSGGQLHVAHVDHGLRGRESDGDRDFVERLCCKLDLPLTVVRLNPLIGSDEANPGNGGRGLESRLRDQRYRCFQKIGEQLGARYLVTGHHRDDQVETVLFRIFRGTGINGLAGIPGSRKLSESVTLLRPMLTISRNEILAELDQMGQTFRVDSSNHSDRFTRNRLRNSILPEIRVAFGNDVGQAVAGLASRADRLSRLVNELAKPVLECGFQVSPGRIDVDARALDGQHLELIVAACRLAWSQAGFSTADMNDQKWTELAGIIKSNRVDRAPGQMYPGGIRATWKAGRLELVSSKKMAGSDQGPEMPEDCGMADR